MGEFILMMFVQCELNLVLLCRFKKWEKWEPVIKKEDLRKGELWMSMHRRHAGMVVGDVTYYRKFKLDCHHECVKDEMFAQTLLYIKDPQVRSPKQLIPVCGEVSIHINRDFYTISVQMMPSVNYTLPSYSDP